MLRVRAVSALPRGGGPEYAEGLRGAVSAGLDYGLVGVERGEQAAPPVPETLLAQARLAARSGVSLDIVLRRYLAGHTLLDDFLIEEAERTGSIDPAELKRVLRSQAAIVDRLLAAVSKAYTEEAERRPPSAERRRAERIERLLSGEVLGLSGFGYDFQGRHVGLIVSGPGAREATETLAARSEAQLLTASREAGTVWAWLGSRRRLEPGELEGMIARDHPAGLSLAIGEPGEGLFGWRLTHRQARAARAVALRSTEPIVRYADVVLLASVMQDELLVTSLRSLYLDPLVESPERGAVFHETLRAYFATSRNVSSAAAMLNVDRRTVTNRIRAVEECLGRPFDAYALDLEIALRLDELA